LVDRGGDDGRQVVADRTTLGASALLDCLDEFGLQTGRNLNAATLIFIVHGRKHSDVIASGVHRGDSSRNALTFSASVKTAAGRAIN
jgi:hypothetical protein